MCSDNPNLPKEANKAKCFVIACFVLCAAHPAGPRTRGSSNATSQTHCTLTSTCSHVAVHMATQVHGV